MTINCSPQTLINDIKNGSPDFTYAVSGRMLRKILWLEYKNAVFRCFDLIEESGLLDKETKTELMREIEGGTIAL